MRTGASDCSRAWHLALRVLAVKAEREAGRFIKVPLLKKIKYAMSQEEFRCVSSTRQVSLEIKV